MSQVRQNEIKTNMEKSYATLTHHTHVHDIQHIALFDRLYLDPKANPKFLNFKDLGTHLQVIKNNFSPKFSTCKNVGDRVQVTGYTHILYMYMP